MPKKNGPEDSVVAEMMKRHFEKIYEITKSYSKYSGQMLLNGPMVPSGAMVEYHPISAKDQSRLHQFGSRVLPGIFLGYALYAGGIWKGDIMVADIEELEEMDASELHARRLNANEVLTPLRSWKLHFPNRRWNSQSLWVRTASENTHLKLGASGTRRRTRNSSRKFRRMVCSIQS